MESIETTLPTGFGVENKWYRNARLRPLNGQDEEGIIKSAQVFLPVERVTILLTCCLKQLGPKSGIDLNDVRSLTAGDRDALLIHLRRLTFGDKIQSVLTCPHSRCEEKMDLQLRLGNMLVPPNPSARGTHETTISENGTVYSVNFRLPTGADQEVVARLARSDIDAASRQLLQRCIEGIKKNGAKIKPGGKVPIRVAESISNKIAELDPQAEILLRLSCPICNRSFSANFDIADFFFKELAARTQHLHREVHVLALNYHWGERDILNMTHSKRQIYLKLLSDELKLQENQ